MRKTNFLSSLGAKLAFAAVVLTGAMFTSCEQEDLDATFEAGPAKVSINTTVTDGLTGSTIANDKVTFTASDSKFNDAINGTAKFENGVSATALTITATVNGKTATSTIQIAATKAGGTATYLADFVVADGLVFTSVAGDSETKEGWANFTGWSHAASHSHDGNSNWYFNATDYAQPYAVVEKFNTITKASELTKTALFSSLDKVYQEGIIATYDQKKAANEVKEAKGEGKAPAWSYFNVKATKTITTTNWTVETEASKEAVATFTTTGVSGIVFELVEFGNPGHEGHYGHGHDTHGNNQNAGGGISWAE